MINKSVSINNLIFNHKRVWILILVPFFFLNMNDMIFPQTRRALLVGISQYSHSELTTFPECRKENIDNLPGTVADITNMKQLLMSRFHFLESEITVLSERDATRQNILQNFKEQLIDPAKEGDICLFYFSGHGSQITNSLSNQSNKQDETLVPYDWYTGNRDLRDKELKRLFNLVLDKKAYLTVIVDACHSGSIARGPIEKGTYRQAPPNLCDVAEPPDNAPDPAARGAVILAAAQESELAREIAVDNVNDKGKHYEGLFTWALRSTLLTCSPDEAIHNVMLRVEALMHSEGLKQINKYSFPDLQTKPEIRNWPLFCLKPGEAMGMAFAVKAIHGNTIIINGGLAAGILENCELQKAGNPAAPVHVRVSQSVQNLNECQTTVFQGEVKNIKVGDLFTVEKWVMPRESRMRVWFPTAPFSAAELMQLAKSITTPELLQQVEWLNDPTSKSPDYTMYWNSSSWQLLTPKGKIISLGKKPKTDDVLQQIKTITPQPQGKPLFYLQLPLPVSLSNQIKECVRAYQDTVNILDSSKGTIYFLTGRWHQEKLEYAWRVPDVFKDEEKGFGLPLRTQWLDASSPGDMDDIKNTIVFPLRDLLLKLVKIRAWLQLQTPPPAQNRRVFPYELGLRRVGTQEFKTSGPLLCNDIYGFVLRATDDIHSGNKEKRYAYAFIIDSDGESKLLFPTQEQGNSENEFPATDEWPQEIQMGKNDLFTITPPVGMDTYIVLTTTEKISNLSVFNFDGVRSRGEIQSPLERLLADLSSATRGEDSSSSLISNWSIKHMPVLSKKEE